MIRRLLPINIVTRQYLSAGADFASLVDTLHGTLLLDDQFNRWKDWERAYADKGYRTIPLETFIAHGHGRPLREHIGIMRDRDETAVYHATQFEAQYAKTTDWLK